MTLEIPLYIKIFLLLQSPFILGVPDYTEMPMVRIPAGEYIRVVERETRQTVQKKIYLDEFSIDQFETSVAEYARCVGKGECDPEPLIRMYVNIEEQGRLQSQTGRKATNDCDAIYLSQMKSHRKDIGDEVFAEMPGYVELLTCALGKAANDPKPIGYASYIDAANYCRFVNKRLPTEAEWEKAARGDKDARLYSWGDERPTDCRFANLSGLFKGGGKLCPDGPIDARDTRYPPSPYGVYNLIGNQSEYVADIYNRGFYAKAPYKNPVGDLETFEALQLPVYKHMSSIGKGTGFATQEKRAFRAAWSNTPPSLPGAIANSRNQQGLSRDHGFRCVRR